MGPYGWAWVIVVAMMPVALYALHRATRGSRFGLMRRLVLTLGAIWLVLPAAVPGHPGHVAPAWLVFLLEWGFQRPGDPAGSAMVLAGGAALALAVTVLWTWLARRRRAADGREGAA
jgi:hypothetical protein